MAKRDNDGGNLLAGMIVGGAIGFVAGMILAPRSGDETRTLFSEVGQELRDKADEFIAAARERMSAASESNGRSRNRRDPFDDLDFDFDEDDL